MSKNDAIINISLPKDMKEAFNNLSIQMGTNPTNLIKMFISSSLNSSELSFKTKTQNSFEMEPLDTSDWGKDFHKKTREQMKKLDTLLAKNNI